jgi:hypothetical protein
VIGVAMAIASLVVLGRSRILRLTPEGLGNAFGIVCWRSRWCSSQRCSAHAGGRETSARGW